MTPRRSSRIVGDLFIIAMLITCAVLIGHAVSLTFFTEPG